MTLTAWVVLLIATDGMPVIFTVNCEGGGAGGVVGSIVGVGRGVGVGVTIGVGKFIGVELLISVVLSAVSVCEDGCLNRLLTRNIQIKPEISTVASAMKNTLYAGSERHKLASLTKGFPNSGAGR